MQRLILKVHHSDGCTFSFEDHLPVVFSSPEEFIICLEDRLKEQLANPQLDDRFELGGQQLEANWFIENGVIYLAHLTSVMTLDEFFNGPEAAPATQHQPPTSKP